MSTRGLYLKDRIEETVLERLCVEGCTKKIVLVRRENYI